MKKSKKNIWLWVIGAFVAINVASAIYFFSDNFEKDRTPRAASPKTVFGAKPYCRYWMFASEIRKKDVRFNLDYLKESGFGGVEIAWVYPLNRNSETDTAYVPRQEWLSPEWREIVEFTILYADSIGLGCDLTFGTLWPFGDSRVPFDCATRRFGDSLWRQKITASWEYPKEGYVVDHLSPECYLPYFERIIDAYPRPETKIPEAYFVDSWEVETEKLWTAGFAEEFRRRYGYDIAENMDSLYEPGYEGRLYDYANLVSEKVLKFYEDFDSSLNAVGIASRGQCSGAPTDIISAYAKLDVPEGEALLYEPEFNSIPASAAVLSGKKIVSAETFTCLYGWPRDYIREEQTADLKLLADALFANGINRIVWHGKPHNRAGSDSTSFYASVHVGPEGSLAEEIPEFNEYLEKVSSVMQRGRSIGQVAVYLPTEDAFREGRMPKESQFKWAWGAYEMRYVYFPEELAGRRPIWINKEFLQAAKFSGGKLRVGDISFDGLRIDSEYLDVEALEAALELAKAGLPIAIENRPKNPSSVEIERYSRLADELFALPNVSDTLIFYEKPLVEGSEIPPFWAREEDGELFIFFAPPKAAGLKFPMNYGASFCEKTTILPITVNFAGESYYIDLKFEPYQSLLYKIGSGKAERIDVEFRPKTPIVEERPKDYAPPWLPE